MEVSKTGILNFIDKKDSQFVIPLYQRRYSWQNEHCQRVWDDIISLSKSNSAEHFMGAIIYIKDKSDVNFTKNIIVDGQQRLITITLLLIALRDFFKTNGLEKVQEKIQEHYIIDKSNKDNQKHYKAVLTQDDQVVLESIVNGDFEYQDSLLQDSLLIDNYEFFKNEISLASKEGNSVQLLFKTLSKVTMVTIELANTDKPQEIFESINSTGKELDDSDLIRNYIFMNVEINDQKRIYENYWQKIERNLTNELMNNFFHHYLSMKHKKYINEKSVYDEFKNYFKEHILDTENLCEDILKFSKYYADMRLNKQDDNAELNCLYAEIKDAKMTVVYPLLMKVLDDYNNEKISQKEFCEVINLCLSYYFRQVICNAATAGNNKFFCSILKEIKEDDYINSIKAYFKLQQGGKKFPTDEEFRTAFEKKDIFHTDKCKQILTHLEIFNNYKNASLESLNKKSIEHIVPQNKNLSPEWEKDLGADKIEIQQQYLHTIGNLTLTGYNSKLSDSPFLKKLEMENGFKESNLKLNRYIIEQKTWGLTQIEDRAQELSALACRAWPYPNIADDILKKYQESKEGKEQIIDDSLIKYENRLGVNSAKYLKEIESKISQLDNQITRKFNKYYIRYFDSEGNCFVEIQPLKDALNIFVNIDFDKVNDPKKMCKDYFNLGKLSNYNTRLQLKDFSEINYAADIIKQAFEQDE